MRAVIIFAGVIAAAVMLAGCGGRAAVPKDDPAQFAVKVVNLLLRNH